MSGIHLAAGVEVDRPADGVWPVVADYHHDPDWRAGVVTMAPSTAGPVRPGTTTAEELRMSGRTWRTTGVVTEVAPGRRFSWRTTSGVPASGSRTVTPLPGDRCRVDLALAVTPTGPQRLLRPVLARLLARGLAADAQRLRALVEGATVRG